jgi:CHAT domain-containing protein
MFFTMRFFSSGDRIFLQSLTSLVLSFSLIAPSFAQSTPNPANQSDINASDVNPVVDPAENGKDSTGTAPGDSINSIEQEIISEYSNHFGPLYGDLAGLSDISNELADLGRITGTNPALIYVVSTKRGLRLAMVTKTPEPEQQTLLPNPVQSIAAALMSQLNTPSPLSTLSQGDLGETAIYKRVPEAKKAMVNTIATEFRNAVSSAPDPTEPTSFTDYLQSSQQLYQWIIAPFEADLTQRKIDTIVFTMDSGLRSIPVAALHDGQGFLVEKYNLGVIPSFNLTDTRFASIKSDQMLGMGISQSVGDLSALSLVKVEVPTLTDQIWTGESYLDESVTYSNLEQFTQQKQYGIIHLATHAQFNAGSLNNSFVQLWDRRMSLKDLRAIAKQAKWTDNPTIELLVLSACETALGNDDAELGFTGLALQTGVKSALGSLWFVGEDGTLALMSEFYRNLSTAPIKSAALRNAQVAMIKGDVVLQDGQLKLADGTMVPLPEELVGSTTDFRDPYFWSAFTLIGNWN